MNKSLHLKGSIKTLKRQSAYRLMGLLFGCVLLFWLLMAAPSQAHWADMAAAEITVGKTDVQMTLTFPTGLAAFADDDQNGQLSAGEIRTHAAQLQAFLEQQIRLTNSEAQPGLLTVKPLLQLPSTAKLAPNSHSNIQLTYTWPSPIQALKIDYNLFLPNVSTASCLATILQNHQLQTFVFTPKQRALALGWAGGSEIWLAIAGAILWGALHSLSPGHGKTIVGAYLVGTRATPKHALFLALTSTITHTLGVFALGLITLFASRYILPEQLYPWLSLISGFMVALIGFNLFFNRWKPRKAAQGQLLHSHTHIHHGSDRQHFHHYHSDRHHSDHFHHHHSNHHRSGHAHHHHHSHLPPDNSAITWKGLLALGISGGLIPCPAALVLMLSAIALGKVGLGLVLVLAFSLGLAGVLTGLGLSLVYAKRLFHHLPAHIRPIRILPILSAVGMMLIGFGISTRAVLQMLA